MFDLASGLEGLLQEISAHTVTNIFIFAIIFVFGLSLFFAYKGNARRFTQYTSGLLTSLGILGTFTGIVIGLLDFDPKHIDQSIELLLNGLKTAFITSLVGMLGAIIFKTTASTRFFKENRQESKLIGNVEPKDILQAIQKQDEKFNELIGAISGGDESSLIGQIKLLRTETSDSSKKQLQHLTAQGKMFTDFSEKLWGELSNFADILSKSATETIIEALKDVITDFNNNLTEQFGENFKALDASVKKLVEWQNNYAGQLEDMTQQYSQGVQAISDIEKSVTSINRESKSIPDTMSSLKDVMEVNQHQINELSSHLEAFKEIKKEAVQAFPAIQDHVKSTINEISEASKLAIDGSQKLVKNTEGVQESFTENLEKMQNQLENTISELVKKQITEIDNTFNALESKVEDSVDTTGKAINKHLEMIDESMSKEVTRVMEEMGTALASISGQFTNDYQKLVTEMGRVTRAQQTAGAY